MPSMKPGSDAFTHACFYQLNKLYERDMSIAPPEAWGKMAERPEHWPSDKGQTLYLHNHVPYHEYRLMDYVKKTKAARALAAERGLTVIL